LFYGDPSQFVAQLIGVCTNFIYVAAISWVVFKVIGLITGGMRVSPETELDGLDIPEMGTEGYAGVRMDKNSETPLSR